MNNNGKMKICLKTIKLHNKLIIKKKFQNNNQINRIMIYFHKLKKIINYLLVMRKKI